MFEVDQKADLQVGDFQVVQHLAYFVVCDFVDCLCIHNDQVKTDQIRHVDSFVHRQAQIDTDCSIRVLRLFVSALATYLTSPERCDSQPGVNLPSGFFLGF